MKAYDHLYIGGEWTAPCGGERTMIVNPANEEEFASVALGDAADIDRAVAAAQEAFADWSRVSVSNRIALLQRVIAGLSARQEDLAQIVSAEMGAPITLARQAHAPSAIAFFAEAAELLQTYPFEEVRGATRVLKQPIGVCGLITAWNWPLAIVAGKVAPALAAGCTIVLKPSELAPINALLFAEILHEAGIPPGVFNLVTGTGPIVGEALSAHPGIDMVSITGSTRAGIAVAKAAAPTVKRVTQELGGKSANIVLDDADFAAALPASLQWVMMNSGQSCAAPTRMLVSRKRYAEAVEMAAQIAASLPVGDPRAETTALGPVANKNQFARVQNYIERGLADGARVAAGGPGRPDGVDKGYFVRPTIFADVANEMMIAREEIFGPVLCIIPYQDEAEAVRIANDSEYGLSSFVFSRDAERAARIGAALKAGDVHFNGAPVDFKAPYGGVKRSGNGREYGAYGLSEFLEPKSMLGFPLG